jgi:hypothetical protein
LGNAAATARRGQGAAGIVIEAGAAMIEVDMDRRDRHEQAVVVEDQSAARVSRAHA